jgi:hypothetical protein
MGQFPSTWVKRRPTSGWWFRVLAIPAVGLALAGLALDWFRIPWLTALPVVTAVTWVMIRELHVRFRGVALWCLAVVAGSIAYSGPLTTSIPLIRWGGELLGLYLALGSAAVFLVDAWKNPLRRPENCACCNLAVFTVLVGITSGSVLDAHLRALNTDLCTERSLIALHRWGVAVEALRAKVDRYPIDEADFVALRGSPMPRSFQEYQITYHHLEGDRYYLCCSLPDAQAQQWDASGGIVFYYGTKSPRRMRLVLY